IIIIIRELLARFELYDIDRYGIGIPVIIHAKIKFQGKILGDLSDEFGMKTPLLIYFKPFSFLVIEGYHFPGGVRIPATGEITSLGVGKVLEGDDFVARYKIVFGISLERHGSRSFPVGS